MALGLSPESSLFLGIDLLVALALLTRVMEHFEPTSYQHEAAAAFSCANMVQEENTRE